MSKREGGSLGHFISRFLGGAVGDLAEVFGLRGGFEGPELYRPSPNQFPKVILVDGVAVEPKVDLPDDYPFGPDAGPAPTEANAQEG